MILDYNEVFDGFCKLIDSKNTEIYFESIINVLKINKSVSDVYQAIGVLRNTENKKLVYFNMDNK